MSNSKIDKLLEGVTEIKTDVKHLAAAVKDVVETVKLQNGRIGRLEQFKSKVVGALGVGVPVISAVVNWVMRGLK